MAGAFDIRLKGFRCPECRENTNYLEINTFQDYYGVESVQIWCVDCQAHYVYKLVQVEKSV